MREEKSEKGGEGEIQRERVSETEREGEEGEKGRERGNGEKGS
jgi:hypothetical protein